MQLPVPTLLVLRANDLATSRRFYEALGCIFKEEQHGSGPLHLASELGGLVLEIYPGQPAQALDRRAAGATMLGFGVSNLDAVLAEIQTLGATMISEPKLSPWGRRAVVSDPDGRALDLSEPVKN